MSDEQILESIAWHLTVAQKCGSATLSKEEFSSLCDFINRLKEENKHHEKAEYFAEKAIEAQEKEIEKLNVELVGMRGACESYEIRHDKAQAKLEKLQNDWKEYTSKTKYCIEVLQTQLAQAKSEAYREFAHLIKKELSYIPNLSLTGEKVIDVDAVDTFLNKLTESNE